MRAVTFQAPGEVEVDEVAEPELLAADDALVRVEASGICGSDLHIYHGRVQIEPGFVIGHEFVGDVMGTGFHAIDSRPLAEGETAAILGMGPVGLCAVQAAKAAGASEVVAIDTVEDRLRDR